MFTTYFTLEIAAKAYMFGVAWWFCDRDARFWNWFDMACMGVAYVDIVFTYAVLDENSDSNETAALMTLKLLRLARLTRLVRLLQFKCFKELKEMVLGVFTGMRVLFWAIVLLAAVVYILGIATRKMIGPTQEEFATVNAAMFTVFRCFVDGCSAYNGTPLQERLRMDYGPFFMILYCLVFLLVTFGLFNLIMALFIDNVVTAQAEKKRKEMEENASETRNGIELIVSSLALNSGAHDGKNINEADVQITREIFDTWLDDPDMDTLLEDAGIDISSKHDLYDVLDVDLNGALRFPEIVDGLMRLRGDVTKADIVAVRTKVRYITVILEELAATVCGSVPSD
eukprot:TRINITY_DN18723_c0_g3_i1.p1 TRINITY_DN18723_c0_g3~~TRINITY_DN18723_c0_g3_i1.p1  ORF type:complete len:341 (-),score=46.51 TRINITY_DN18723_c0_g3_i1:70-1092(-)